MGERRATATGEKTARRLRMLTAAAELLRGWSFTDITMDRIADQTGVAKGTLYLYFRTKEAIFLQLYEERLGAWYAELESLATRGTGTVEPADAARIIVTTLSARPTLIHLHGLLHSTLGRNIDLETTLGFRRRQRQMMSSLALALSGRIKDLGDVAALHFLIRLEAVVGGLSWAAFPPAALQRAFDEPALEVFRIDFEEELRVIVTALLR